MPVDDQVAVEQQNTPPVGQHPDKQARTRQSDEGPAILPGMQHFVTLLRKAKRPGLVLLLVERASNTLLPELSALTDAAKGILPIQSRKAMFHAVAKLSADVQQRIERAAERVVLLDDEYGAQAVQSLLDEQDVGDAAILAMPSDRYSRALHLCLLQDFPENGAKREQRFDHAERLQVMHRQWKSENYSSHYLGPKGVVPKVDANAEDVLRARIAALFPQVAPDQILIEQFTRRDLAHADRCGGKDADEATPVLLHTLTATFNGSTAHFQQVANGEVIDHEEPAAMSASFSWEPDTGALGVFCEDREVRRDLATAFRDVVLACEGEINDMPMREFDLFGFSTPAMLKRLEQDRVAGIEKISILQIKIARPFEQQTTDEANGRDLIQHLSSTLLIGRDRRDTRNIYQLAYDDYGLDDLTGYALAQVKLVVRMAKQPHRKAHNVAVQITSPNGLNDKSKTEDDRKRVLEQLVRIGVLREF
ncbi:hypothetical protein C6P92_05375 [Burkholderia multivorans]|uniref:hypothetical protein n=1 Tax=Burkholderiales TaxID=80840 RepID=UPI000CFE9E47|nr:MULTISPECIES: hypothetical protein [Burkholderiales]PRE26246.1 hypothetical protein C6P92_05375 [Burkholderia multivorans]UZG45583.1 hypothetical protein ONZ46_06435 [Caldimonas thermodepolymerans]